VNTLFGCVVGAHAELHAIDPQSVGLADFGKPEGYVERQVAGWSSRYRRARTQDVPDCEEIMRWLEDNRPPEIGVGCIVHNDFRLDNLVLDASQPTRIIGVLDWEMATLGDPLMDLGASLAYWVEAADPPEMRAMRMMPTVAEGAPTRAEVVERYAAASGIAIDDIGFYYAFGLFRLAVIVQQIYYRAYHGQTKDPRFQNLNQWVAVLAEAAGRLTR
jgi:aminoglycoside phosphotransferase (APT) family kinase protein